MILAILLLATALSYPIGLAARQAWLLPLLNTLPAYVAMAWLLRRQRRQLAVTAMLAWAAALTLCGTASFIAWPAPESLVVGGAAYRDEMFTWIRSGEGREGDPRLFLPQHAIHLGAFVVVSLLTASALSILMGAVLMNYMSFYVASLFHAGVPGGAVVFWGWQPWALCRVAAFCVLGVVLAEPLLSRLLRYPHPGLSAARRYLAWAAIGLAADVLLKALLAPQWGRVLRGFLT